MLSNYSPAPWFEYSSRKIINSIHFNKTHWTDTVSLLHGILHSIFSQYLWLMFAPQIRFAHFFGCFWYFIFFLLLLLLVFCSYITFYTIFARALESVCCHTEHVFRFVGNFHANQTVTSLISFTSISAPLFPHFLPFLFRYFFHIFVRCACSFPWNFLF